MYRCVDGTMRWFDGTVAAAVQRVQSDHTLLVVFVNGMLRPRQPRNNQKYKSAFSGQSPCSGMLRVNSSRDCIMPYVADDKPENADCDSLWEDSEV
jgi:hypothetical protein